DVRDGTSRAKRDVELELLNPDSSEFFTIELEPCTPTALDSTLDFDASVGRTLTVVRVVVACDRVLGLQLRPEDGRSLGGLIAAFGDSTETEAVSDVFGGGERSLGIKTVVDPLSFVSSVALGGGKSGGGTEFSVGGLNDWIRASLGLTAGSKLKDIDLLG